MSDGTSHLGVVTFRNKSISALHALVIGIDHYLHQPHLFGACADANRIVDFLVDDLGTPRSHIVNLRDNKATRAKIIQGFQDLRDNSQVERGSPILIYFAGHGGLAPASESWVERYRTLTTIQVIFPYDYDEEYGGERVNCIPDKTIARLLNELAEAKGDNITVIFDSCHSASGSRGSATRQARNAKVKFDIPVDLDDKIFLPVSASSRDSARETNLPLCSHQTSHIHLAACGSNERAWEEEGAGEFTSAILKTIRAHGVDKVSYHNLMLGLPYLTKQTPHCYGAHRNRRLFDGRVPSQTVAYIPVIYDPSQGTLILQAGAASGVTYESIWELRGRPVLGDEAVIGTTVAGYPAVSRAPLRPETEEGNNFWELCKSGSPYEEVKIKLYARLVKSGPGSELKVWFSPEVKRLVFPELEDGSQDSARGIFREFDYVAHPSRDSADMLVEIYNSGEHPTDPASSPSGERAAPPEVVFHLCNPHAQKYGVATLRERKVARRSEVETVLSAASRWHWYLNQTNPSQASGLVEMEMFKIAERAKVKGVYSDIYWWQIKESERVNLNIDETNVVDFEVYEKDLYAIRLKSKVDRPLYVRMFYFDMATLLIDDQFGHTTANKRADPDIDAFGSFTIGDDHDGGTPLPFGLDPGETIDVGCLKVFWSTDPLELNNLSQDSAFSMKRKVVKKSTGIFPNSEWGTEVLTLVQRAPAAVAETK